MSWAFGDPSAVAGQWDVGPIIFAASFDNAPVIIPPPDTELFFANGGAGLSKSNAQLVALLATATATDVEDGVLAVTADLSALADPIPAGTHTIPLSATDSDGLTGASSFQLTVTESTVSNPAPTSSGNYTQQSATVGVPFSFDGSQNISDPGDTLTFSISGVSWLSIDSATGQVSGTPTAAGAFTATITATDSVGQPVSVLLPVSVVAENAVLFPISRTVAWDEGATPNLVVGDTFWHQITLLHGGSSEPFNAAAAESINVAVIAEDHTQAYCDQVAQDIALLGADWGNGIVSLYLSGTVTAQIAAHITRPTLAKVEIEVVLNGNEFTWYAPVKLIPGYVN